MRLRFSFTLTIANKILYGYIIILAVAVFAAMLSIFSLRSNQAIDRQINQVNLPFYLHLKELNVLAAELNKLTNSWIYQPDMEEKQKMLNLVNNTYPDLNGKLMKIMKSSTDSNTEAVESSLAQLKQLVDAEVKVTKLLSEDSLYANDVVVDEAIQLMDQVIAPQTAQLDKLLTSIIKSQEEKIAQSQIDKEKSYVTLTYILIFMVIAFIATAIAAYYNVKMKIVTPIVSLRDVLVDLGRGKIITLEQQSRTDEVGQMHNAMANLTKGLHIKSSFSSQIGLGNYDEKFELLSDDDAMGKALITMRDNLKKNAEEERRRNWAVTGLAKFGELLRNQDQDLEKFGDQVLTFAIRYIGANQGRMFIVNDDHAHESYLQLVSCYAWDKKKYLHQRIEAGEGLTGQCWQEGEPIYMTQVPENFVKITSGLGMANPKNIFIVPLKVNDTTYGVLELASFNILSDYERDFILKLSENLAAAIGTVRINAKTKVLLAQTQQQAEEMRSQEEEMRQNMEELNATQEEMIRKEKEYVRKIEELENALANQRISL